MPDAISVLPVLQQVSAKPGCVGCPRAALDGVFVPPVTPPTSTRLVVGDCPTLDDVIEGKPFSGDGWMPSLYRKAGVNYNELSFTNVVQCYSKDAPTASHLSKADADRAMAHCMDAYVWPMLHGQQWTRVDALGEVALTQLTGQHGLDYWRGSPLKLKGAEKETVVPTLHPKDIGGQQLLLPVILNDLKKSTQVPPEFYSLAPTLQEVRDFAATEFASDIESNPATNSITMVGLTSKSFHVLVVPFTGAYIPELKRIFAAAKTIYLQNGIQFDAPLLAENGVKVSDDCKIIDIMLGQHLLFPDLSHDLEFIASQFTNKPAWKSQNRGEPGYWELRNARDTDVTWMIGKTIVPMLKQHNLWDLYHQVQVPLARICHLMTETGIKLNPENLKVMREKLLRRIAEQELLLPAEIRAYDKPKRVRYPAPEGTLSPKGKPVKWLYREESKRYAPYRSGKTLKTYLYTTLGIPEQKHPKSKKVTTDKSAVEKCIKWLRKEGRLEEVKGLQAYQAVKRDATFLSGFATAKMEKSGMTRQHPRFNVQGTGSGRLSSAKPNFQNQPEQARCIYVPSHAGWKIIEFDYSNIEPRLTAYFANDLARLARFSEPGYNDHKFTTSMFFDIPYDEVIKDNDKDAPYGISKRINNGLNYGMGVMKIANTFGMDYLSVKKWVAQWKGFNNATAKWQQETAKEAEATGLLTTPFGRKRWFYTSTLYTESLSFLPQSSAADIIFKAMIGLMYERINWPMEEALKVCRIVKPLPRPARLLLQVHDSLIFEAPSELVDEVVATVLKVMAQPVRELGGISIPVDCKVGDSWGECEPYIAPRLAA